MKIFCLFAALSALHFGAESSYAATITKVKNKAVMIRLSGENVKSGDTVSVVNKRGKEVGTVKIKKVKGKKALGSIVSGKIKRGYKLSLDGGSKKSGKSASSTTSAKKQKIVNLSINPVPLFLTSEIVFDLDVSLGTMTIGPIVSIFSESTTALGATARTSGMAYGLRSNIYFSGPALDSGMFLGILAEYVTSDYEFEFVGAPATSSATGIRGGALIGYQQFFGPGINITAGLGGAFGTIPNATLTTSGLEATIINPLKGFGLIGEVALGIAF